ncbi:octanoyl-[acyl-carrier-protein]:protein N-octanoyltransferase LIPT2, mitochondrial isoform X2 [Erythrolamprus reginae]|uniref:octanoyl-[acyl-carrier-protein]:protein N-octanoyltransferase LIPT2, mitochondrial isoform X2 n=1 Tax=Erythrolamprus reginae TaxID=121349 RepID=UPI00396CFBFC
MAGAASSSSSVRLVRLGRASLGASLAAQATGAALLLRADGGAAARERLVLWEPRGPVYTSGLRGEEAEAPGLAGRLRALGAEVARVGRGGRLTFHGPGQLVAYPVLDLRRRRLALRAYVAALERLARDTCRRLGLSDARALPPPRTGVWLGDRKLCAIGPRGRAFSVAAPTLWNQLPPEIRTALTLLTFRKLLKTHLCRQAWGN